jgi:hypothetical protein
VNHPLFARADNDDSAGWVSTSEGLRGKEHAVDDHDGGVGDETGGRYCGDEG